MPPVNGRLKASSWKTKKIAIVTTTNVCRRVRSAIEPDRDRGEARHQAGERQQREHASSPPATCQSCAVSATVYAPVPKNTAWPSAR